MAKIRERRIITDSEMLMDLMRWRDEYYRWPSYAELDSAPEMQTASTYCYRFGDMKSARAAARLYAGKTTAAENQQIRRWSPILLGQLERLAEQQKFGKRITLGLLANTPGAPSPSDLARYCCGLNNALRRLKLPVSDPTREELIVVIQNLAKTIGHAPRLNDIDVQSCGYSRAFFAAEFVYWNDALVEAGLQPYVDQSKKRKPPEYVQSKSARANASCSDS